MDLGAFCSRACALALAWLLFGAPAQAHSFDRVRVLSNDEIIAATGRSVTEWGNAWWTWAFEHPEIFGDTTGELGYLGDVDGRVFFAEASGGEPFEGRVQVPRGEYVLLPVATYIRTFFDPCAEIRCARKIVNDNAIKNIQNVFVSIDGRPVRDLGSHLVTVDGSNPLVFSVYAGPKDEDGYGGDLSALQGGLLVDAGAAPARTALHRIRRNGSGARSHGRHGRTLYAADIALRHSLASLSSQVKRR